MIQESVSLKYEPSSLPQHISVKWLFLKAGVCGGSVPLELPSSLFFFTLVTGPRRSLSLKLSHTRVYEPQIPARLVTTTHFCDVVVLRLTLQGLGFRVHV